MFVRCVGFDRFVWLGRATRYHMVDQVVSRGSGQVTQGGTRLVLVLDRSLKVRCFNPSAIPERQTWPVLPQFISV